MNRAQQKIRDARILRYIKRHPQMRQVDYSMFFGLSQTTIVRIMARGGIRREQAGRVPNPFWAAKQQAIADMLRDHPTLPFTQVALLQDVPRDRVVELSYKLGLPARGTRGRPRGTPGVPMPPATKRAIRAGYRRWLRQRKRRTNE